MQRRVIAAGCGLALVLCCFGTEAWATSARKGALVGNFLIEDDTDVFLFPSLTPLYTNGIYLDMTVSDLNGNGGFMAEQGVAFGAFFHRPETFLSGLGIPSDFSEIDTLYTDIDLDSPFKLFDLLLAFRIGQDKALGIDVAFAHSLDYDKTDGTITTGDREMAVSLTVGFSSGIGKAFRNDLGLEVRFNYFEEVAADTVLYEGKPIPSFSLVDRMVLGKPGFFAWGFDWMFSRRDYSASIGPDEGSAARYIVGMRMGPRLTFIDRILVAASLQLLYDAYGGDVERATGPDEPMGWQHNFIAPGFNMATEITIFPWLFLRAGFDYRYLSGLYRYEVDTPVSVSQTAVNMSHRFLWSVGMGLSFKGVHLDAVFAAPLFMDGPDFIGGRSPGMFSMLSLSYLFQGGGES